MRLTALVDMKKNVFKPLTIESRNLGKFRTISSVKEAYEVLVSDWDGRKHGPACSRAKMTCLAAIEGTQSAIEARTAFLDAAVEANILVDDHCPSRRKVLLETVEDGETGTDFPSQKD